MAVKDVEEFLQTARERFDFGRQADSEDRERAEAANRFANADNKGLQQWDDKAKRARRKRPVLQWNRIPVFVAQVVNDGRQNKPAIKIAPDDQGTPETAEYYQNRIRHIEYEANADTAKDTAREQQVMSGRGFMRVYLEKVPGSDRQRICIDRIENQFSVVWDPGAVQYDRSDAAWCFVISQITRDKHKEDYGEESTLNRLDFTDAVKMAPTWVGVGENGEMVQIADYYVREKTKDGYKVTHYVINGIEILNEYSWIGSTIPIVPVWGREAVVDGKRCTYSLIENAKGPQQLLNLYVSNAAELIGQMPKSPFLVPVGGIPADAVGDWAKVNTEALAYLLYNAYEPDGSMRQLPAPSRNTAEPPIQALAVGINQCIDGIKSAMGIYDASLGAKSNEQSGIAIQRRKTQASITNYHFPDNEARSNKYLGQILIEIIPLVDPPGSVNTIRTEDGKTYQVPVGQPYKHYKTGKVVTHDLKSGQYSVTVSTGPSYLAARQEMYERDVALVQAQPELIFAIGPQMFRADDTAGSEERAEALERYINLKFPGLIPPKDQDQQIPPQVQQQVMAMNQELQKTRAFAQSLHEQLQSKQPELDTQIKLKAMEIDWQREKAQIESKTKLDVAALAQGITADIAHLQASIDMITSERGLQQQAQAQASTQQHAVDMSDKTHQNAMEQQTQAQQAAQEAQESQEQTQ